MEPFRAQIPNNFILPRRIARLGKLAYNLWWTWTPDAQRLFQRIDKDVWERTNHNPIRFLRQVSTRLPYRGYQRALLPGFLRPRF